MQNFDLDNLDVVQVSEVLSCAKVDAAATIAKILRRSTKEELARVVSCGGIDDFSDAENEELLAAISNQLGN